MPVASSEEEMNLLKEMVDKADNKATPTLPITVLVKHIKDLLYLLIGLHPYGHHGQELVQLYRAVIVLQWFIFL